MRFIRDGNLALHKGTSHLTPKKRITEKGYGIGPMLDRIFIRLGPASPMPPSLAGLLVRTCMGTLRRWEPM